MLPEAFVSLLAAVGDPAPQDSAAQNSVLYAGFWAGLGTFVTGVIGSLVYYLKATQSIKKDDRDDVLHQYRHLLGTYEKRIALLERKMDRQAVQMKETHQEVREAHEAHTNCMEDNKRMRRRMDKYENILKQASLWPVAFDSDKGPVE